MKQNWEKLKLKEGKKSVLEGVPKGLPALVKASRIQDKVKGVGFDWEEPHQVWDKVQEELQELQVEVASGNQDKIEAEFGDVLFSMINYARFLKVNPEDALERTNKKFIKRFQYLESKAGELGKPLMDMTLAEMDVFGMKRKTLKLNNGITLLRCNFTSKEQKLTKIIPKWLLKWLKWLNCKKVFSELNLPEMR